MAQLAVAAVGAVAGAYLLPAGVALGAVTMSGAGIGWMAGSLIGAALFAPSAADGPRLSDKRVSSNTYGEAIPICYGTIRVAGHVLWSSALIESEREEGGKGGGGGVTMYSYSVNQLLSVCEAPVEAVLRIWANGRLIWRNDGTPDGEVDAELLQRGNVRIYLGDEAQMPDPTYEAAVGTENAVAYRGQCVVAIDGLQLEFAGNRPPSLEFEVTTSAEATGCPVDPFHPADVQQTGLMVGVNGVWSHDSFAAALDPVSGTFYVVTNGADGTTRQIEAYSTSGEAPAFIGDVQLPEWQPGNSALHPAGIVFDPENRLLRIAAGYAPTFGTTTTIPIEYTWDVDGETLTESAAWFGNTFGFTWGNFPIDGEQGGTGARVGALSSVYPYSNTGAWGEVGWWTHSSSIINYRLPRLVNGSNGVTTGHAWHLEDFGARQHEIADVVYVPLGDDIVSGGGLNYALKWSSWLGYYDLNGTTVMLDGALGSDVANRRTMLVYAPNRLRVYAIADVSIATINVAADMDDADEISALTEIAAVADWGVVTFAVWSAQHDGLLLGHISADETTLVMIDPDTRDIIAGPCVYDQTIEIRAPKDLGDGRFVCLYGDAQVAIVDMPGGSVLGGPITLREIVEDVCERAGLPAENIDATAGTDLVGGYKIGKPTSARAVIEQLRPGYFFDIVESGEQIVLRKRGAAAVATITAGEMGAHVFQLTGGDPEPAYEMEHVEEIEAPRELSVQYLDADANYDPGVQTARRQATTSQAISTIEIPVVFDGGADEAATVAWRNLIHAHASKNSLTIKLSHHYEALEAADAINIPLSGGDFQRVRIDQIERSRPLLELRCALEDGSLYGLAFDGGDRGIGPQQTQIGQLANTALALIDTSPLQDADDVSLLYVAMGPASRAVWGGAVLYKSSDAGSSYESVLTTTAGVTTGLLAAPLGDWTGGNRWDDQNTLTVVLSNGTFSSATQLGVLNGANALAVASGSDWEILQFTTAELVGTDTWELSGLLRGRKGTERAMAGHAIGNRVVLLTATTLRQLATETGEVGLLRHYKAPTSGQAVADVSASMLTFSANTLRPLSPVHIAGARDGGDLTITWVRRARINAGWADSIDVPLDEPSESYEIDVLDGTTVVRTLTAATTTVEYTAAQQTTDFGSPQAAVDVVIPQISSRVGRGHAGTATV